MNTAWIISSGTELTLGQTVDTNGAWLARQLAALGIRCTRLAIVPDDLADITDVLSSAAADVVLMTGGLGPTPDDLTREAIARATGDQLVSDPESLAQLRAFFAARGRDMPPANAVQALRPSRSVALPNPIGTAPGILARIGNRECFAMPGVPHEMRRMFEQHVAPRLRDRGAGRALLSRRLNSFGLTESEVGQRLADLMQRGNNPEVGTTADMGIIGVRINALAATTAEAETLLDSTENEVRIRLGEAVFGREGDTLASDVCATLIARGETLACAESCTGGLIGKLITDVPGSSRCLTGGVVAYANAVKQDLLGVSPALLESDGAVSEPVARAMANAVRQGLRTTYGLSVTGIAGPGGASEAKPVGLVFIALAADNCCEARRLLFGDQHRELIRLRAAHAALGLLRKHLLSRAAP